MLARSVLTVLVSTGLLVAQGESPIDRIAQAEKRLVEGQIEAALIDLLRIDHSLAPFADDLLTRAARKTIDELLKQHDKNHAGCKASRTIVAGHLLQLARKYQRKKWMETAGLFLTLGGRYDRAVVQKAQTYFEKKQKAQAKSIVTAKPKDSGDKQPQNRFEDWKTAYQFGTWEFRNGQVRSPKPAAETFVNMSSNVVHADQRISVEVRIGAKQGQAGLIIGGIDSRNYLFVTLDQSPKIDRCRIALFDFKAPNSGPLVAIDPVADNYLPRIKLPEDQWWHLIIDVRGPSIEVSVDGRKALSHTLSETRHGKLGLYLTGGAVNAHAIMLRNLKIEELPKVDEGKPDKAIEDTRVQNEILEGLEYADGLAKAGKRESAFYAARAMRKIVRRIKSKRVRGFVSEDLESKIVKLDIQAKARQKTLEACARERLSLAKQYETNGSMQLALEMASGARQFSPSIAQDEYARLLEASAVQAEPLTKAANTTLIQELEKVEALWGKGAWKRDEDGIVSPKMAGKQANGVSTMLASRRRLMTKATVSVQAKGILQTGQSTRGCCALAFGLRSPSEFYLLCWWPDSDYAIRLLYYKKGTWTSLAEPSVRYAKAARGAWTTLKVSYDDKYITATVGLSDPIVVETQGHVLGKVGCYVESLSGKVSRFAFRNLVISK